jgi:acid stress-induced BolA-like protein IbaG/YrbA
MIKQGKQGKNKGLPSGFPKLDRYTYGLQRKYMTVIAGDQGSGKSSLALYMYVYRPLMEYINGNKNIHVLYFSFEMSSEVLMAKLLSIYIWETFKEEISYSQILSLTEEISDDSYDYIKKSVGWLNAIESRMTIIDKSVSPKGVYAITKDWALKHGTLIDIDEHKSDYIPNDPEQMLIAVMDHVRLLSSGTEPGTKAKIDECMDYCVGLRNKMFITWCILVQLNREFKSMDRRNSNYQYLQLNDLADSSSPAQSAECVIGIFDAYREKMKACEGYKLDQLKDNFRFLQLLKNRFGESNKNVGVLFYGSIGLWEELPKPSEIDDYDVFKKLKSQWNATDDEIPDPPKERHEFTF